jgi:trehalose/maltose transport system permease protein
MPPYGNIMAASVVVSVPLVVLVLVFQRWITSGLTMGAVKG